MLNNTSRDINIFSSPVFRDERSSCKRGMKSGVIIRRHFNETNIRNSQHRMVKISRKSLLHEICILFTQFETSNVTGNKTANGFYAPSKNRNNPQQESTGGAAVHTREVDTYHFLQICGYQTVQYNAL